MTCIPLLKFKTSSREMAVKKIFIKFWTGLDLGRINIKAQKNSIKIRKLSIF